MQRAIEKMCGTRSLEAVLNSDKRRKVIVDD